MSLTGKCVLVVDDDQMVLSSLQLIMESWGLEVLAAEDLSQVKEKMQLKNPDLVLSDLRLRDNASGFDVVAFVRSTLADIPAIILTGETGKDVLAEGVRRGLAFLHKPVQGALLREALLRALDKPTP